ncbi:hypothetical protein BGZ61DRAFT_537650 [Ilyonectria robusta]|uniref:uncharacterized protein n=1 Tax=Ilyonectria robusta TaxID=1079257 RepID=UPI001E8DFAAE|nr:uncharacterized protein BGZ61DRAFT_537650 [Ilyonectria robusta]KAH8670093.1 hypothetical protein BGZ61DRAFT_537650 [Ilyonectria robusta]
MSRLPPAAKLPLAVRKNVRDEWENVKADWEKKFSDLLGVEWTINIDPLSIYPYAEENSYGSNSLGACIASYISGAEWQLKYFISSAGDIVKDEINTLAHAHVITMDFDEEKLFSYCGSKITPTGELAIIFAAGNLGTNIDHAMEKSNLTKALNAADQAGKPMSHSARLAIVEDYDSKIGPVQEKLNKILGKEIPLVPNFEAVYEKLAASSDVRDDYATNLGSFVRGYFEGLNDYLTYQKFDSDDMLQEGLVETLEGNAVHFRIVDKMSKSYNEAVIEDGILYLQTNSANFGTNIHQIADGLVDLL